jgi:hypothetical protein
MLGELTDGRQPRLSRRLLQLMPTAAMQPNAVRIYGRNTAQLPWRETKKRDLYPSIYGPGHWAARNRIEVGFCLFKKTAFVGFLLWIST